MPRRPTRDPAPERDTPNSRPPGPGELGGFITPDASAGRRRPLPAWLPEAPDPPPRGEDSAVRLIPFDEAATTPPVQHVHPVDEHGNRLDAPPTDPSLEVPVAPAARASATPAPAPASGPVVPGPALPSSAAPARASRPSALATGHSVDTPAVRIRPRPPTEVETARVEPPAPAPPAPAERAAPRLRRVLGVNIDGGVAYLALVETPDRVKLDAVERLAPATDKEPHVALADFSGRVARLLREVEIDAVGIVRPLRYANWRYTDALARISVETCFMLEAGRQSLRFEWVGQQHAANVLGVPVERLTDGLAGRLGVERGAGWSKRSPAIVVALAIASELT
jgi:hypothetical protein